MTAKEKAESLLAKMNVIHYRKLGGVNKDSKGLPVSMYDSQIKQCALIAVDEIINSVDNEHVSDIFNDYWIDVKAEIENI